MIVNGLIYFTFIGLTFCQQPLCSQFTNRIDGKNVIVVITDNLKNLTETNLLVYYSVPVKLTVNIDSKMYIHIIKVYNI